MLVFCLREHGDRIGDLYLPSIFLDLLDLLGRRDRVVLLVPRVPMVLGQARSYRLARVQRLVWMESFRLRRATDKLKTILLGRKLPMVDRSRPQGRLL
jgi:hypothetical protein